MHHKKSNKITNSVTDRTINNKTNTQQQPKRNRKTEQNVATTKRIKIDVYNEVYLEFNMASI